MGGRAARQSDDDQRARRPQLPPLPGAVDGRGQADGPVRPRTADRPGQHARQAGGQLSPHLAHAGGDGRDGCSIVHGRARAVRQVPQPPVRVDHPGRLLRPGRLFRPRAAQGGEIRTGRRGDLPGARRRRAEPDDEEDAGAGRVRDAGRPARPRRRPPRKTRRLADAGRQPLFRPFHCQSRLVSPARPRHRGPGGRLPRHQPAEQPGTAQGAGRRLRARRLSAQAGPAHHPQLEDVPARRARAGRPRRRSPPTPTAISPMRQ